MNTSKIKIEPGTSKLPPIIKYEDGRLPSLMTRKLKLGASTNKPAFKPNLVERKKKDVPEVVENNRGRGKVRTRGGDRGRGAPRGRHSQNFIQSQGVFSEGMSEAQKRNTFFADRSHNSNKDPDASKTMDKPTFDKHANNKINKEHEDKVMLDLYDDHIDQENEITNEIYPINLPLIPQIKDKPILVKEKKIKKIKADPDTPEVIIKKEPEVEHFEGADDYKPEVKPEKFLFDVQEKLLLFQFPDCLPGLGPIIEPEKKENSSEIPNDKQEIRSRCSLRDINEGKIGKIVVYKSGKTKLIIGNTTFDIDEGYQPGFLQDVVSVNTNSESKTGDMINLGSIEDSVVITPQFDDLLG